MPMVGLKLGSLQGAPSLLLCSCEIKLVNNPKALILSPHDAIQGVLLVHVNTTNPNCCTLQKIRIQLEGHTISRFQSKVDNRLTDHFRDEMFLPDSNSPTAQSLSTTFFQNEDKTFRPGTHTFPFKLQLSGQEFPPSYKSPFGSIVYKLVAYVDQGSFLKRKVVGTEKILRAKGHLNLNLHPELCEPLVITKQKDKSWFSNRPLVKVHLILEKQGFLPRENLNFALVIENPACDKIVKIQIVFVQKIIYHAKKATKTTRTVLHEEENEIHSCDADIRWETGFKIPAGIIPSFGKGGKYIEINHAIEFTVSLTGTAQLKGEAVIVIGTTSTTTNDLNSAPSGSTHGSRRESFSDLNWDAVSLQSCSTLPPSYSTLTSRRPSLSSIETMPPNYASVIRMRMGALNEKSKEDEDGDDEDEWEVLNEEFRPRCASNVI